MNYQNRNKTKYDIVNMIIENHFCRVYCISTFEVIFFPESEVLHNCFSYSSSSVP